MDDLSRGDEVVLTLADRGILDEKGNLQEDEDELENVRIAEERKRKKAREAAAPKAKPLWEEDGKMWLELITLRTHAPCIALSTDTCIGKQAYAFTRGLLLTG
ncbi:hypothetical protein CEUSTIGMA_g7363.t1 [Chlamydomonas eustigma]|uniref:Uncharacterized protein n=1 Tax=Chlamydomonas eustigma TaxID=1157962 RepID=A0A250X9Y1_9CHLO|nr:hypothetical protein CEUSTIGMA_g7363.t1 [Chlamydomonas eustigma]|eukprot:GAX79923.1 hypothetical protein CEUSTIGMA_g7363.t1 [Chlamydomonas eustigma]